MAFCCMGWHPGRCESNQSEIYDGNGCYIQTIPNTTCFDKIIKYSPKTVIIVLIFVDHPRSQRPLRALNIRTVHARVLITMYLVLVSTLNCLLGYRFPYFSSGFCFHCNNNKFTKMCVDIGSNLEKDLFTNIRR